MLGEFLNYIEIKTKITSTLTFLLTLVFLLYKKVEMSWVNTLIFFAGMFLFDLTTTAINNYIDSKDQPEGLAFGKNRSLLIIYFLFLISTVFGLLLALRTDLVVLLIGGFCFLCGVFYTYGPIPISRMPLGEIISGFFYGGVIPFILMYINMPKGTFLNYDFDLSQVTLSIQFAPFLALVLLAVTPFAVTANIMLANNICDLEKDILVKRHTLPYYIGKKSLTLFSALYYLTYLSLILMVVLKIISPIALISLVTFIPVRKNIRIFLEKQDKATTFNISIKNFILIMSGEILAIGLSILVTTFF